MSSKEGKTHGGGLVRHFTTRRSKNVSTDIGRTGSVSIRSKISGPVELIHTTNMLSYNAPDIHPRSASSTTSSSVKSDSDSDSTAPTVASSNASSPPTSPDISNSPGRKASPEPNHLSCYFTPPSDATIVPSKPAPAPIIPSRAPSHTKKNAEVSRQRSISRFSSQSNHSAMSKTSFSFSRASSTSTSTSHSSMSSHAPSKPTSISLMSPPPMPPPQHALPRHPPHHHKNETMEGPFGQELAKVTELAEEFGVQDKVQAVVTDDEKYMRQHGLRKLTADDYISEIQNLLSDLFADARPAPTPLWI